MRKISENIVKEIVKLKERKVPIPEISKRLKISPSSVKNYTKHVRLNRDENLGGRPNKLSKVMKSELVNKFRKNEIKYLNDARGKLFDKYKVKVCKQTVKNYLNREGVKCYIKQKKPFLSDVHKEKRLKFSDDFMDFSYFEWATVIWSDEKKFSLFNTNHKEYYWKNPRDRPEEHHIKKTKKFGGGYIMTWGCITSKGVGELIKIEGIMDSNKYIDVLSNGLIPTMEKFSLNYQDTLFMQDNDPKHTSKTTKEWLRRNKISVLDWPAQSPDLNPIENLWNQIEQNIRRREKQPTTTNELWEVVKEEWSKITIEKIRSLYMSMINRVNQVKEAKGGYTSY
jgi:transposase